MKFIVMQMAFATSVMFFVNDVIAQETTNQKKEPVEKKLTDVESNKDSGPTETAADDSKTEKPSGPALIAKFSEKNTAYRTLFLYSEVELKTVYVWLNWQWVEAKKEDYPHPGKPYHLYRVSQRFAPTDGRKLPVNSWAVSGERTYRHALTIEKADESFACAIEIESDRSRDEYLADKKESDKRFQDPYGFITLVNHYRATRGLGSLVHDPGLSQDASINNSKSSPHAYMGRARVQNWAAGYGNAMGALRAWQNSPGHNRNLLNPSITRCGISYNGREWTFNGS